MIKEIKFDLAGKRCFAYSGRNGIGKMKGIEVLTLSSKDGAILSPINSKGVAESTWLEVPLDAINDLIYALREVQAELINPIKLNSMWRRSGRARYDWQIINYESDAVNLMNVKTGVYFTCIPQNLTMYFEQKPD